MKNIAAAILVLIAGMIGISLGRAFVHSITSSPEPAIERSIDRSASTEPAYMGITRSDYINLVSNNGQDKGAECAYSYLIDTYGLEATFKMDQRADKNPDDVDPAIYEAIERCI